MFEKGATEMLFADALKKASSYAAAWSSNDPRQVAAHFAENGAARLNSGKAIQGREAIASDYAAPFFRDFPGSSVLLHDFRLSGGSVANFFESCIEDTGEAIILTVG